MPATADILLYVRVLLQVAVVLRLCGLGLAGRYWVLAAGLGVSLARTLGAVLLPTMVLHPTGGWRPFGLQPYPLLYVTTQPLLWVLYFLLLLELYSAALEEFPGVRRLGRLVLFSALAAIALACAALISLDERRGVDPFPFLGYLVLQERSVFVALSAVALLLLLFVSYYRLPVRRNVWVLWACWGGYFLSSAALLTLRWYFGLDFRPTRNLSSGLLYDLALLGTTCLLSRAGETEIRSLSPPWGDRSGEVEVALSLQLQNFNQALVRVLKP